MKTQAPLLPGEQALPSAPNVLLDDGTNCIPQHYLSYHHTIESVGDIVANITYEPNYLLFVDEDKGGIFIQVGIIGLDNYIAQQSQDSQKIVYGRRWRVEPQLPSSEIIQTAFLALMKAREHEIRELIKFKQDDKMTSPFSCHHDLPLMAMSRSTDTYDESKSIDESAIKSTMAKLEYDGGYFTFIRRIELNSSQQLISLAFHPGSTTKLPELLSQPEINLTVEEATENALLFSLMDCLLHLSNRHVEENFKFKSFARFSRKNSIAKISALSAKTRHKGLTESNADFALSYQQNNYQTDETRVPRLFDSNLGKKLSSQLQKFRIGSGILPNKST